MSVKKNLFKEEIDNNLVFKKIKKLIREILQLHLSVSSESQKWKTKYLDLQRRCACKGNEFNSLPVTKKEKISSVFVADTMVDENDFVGNSSDEEDNKYIKYSSQDICEDSLYEFKSQEKNSNISKKINTIEEKYSQKQKREKVVKTEVTSNCGKPFIDSTPNKTKFFQAGLEGEEEEESQCPKSMIDIFFESPKNRKKIKKEIKDDTKEIKNEKKKKSSKENKLKDLKVQEETVEKDFSSKIRDKITFQSSPSKKMERKKFDFAFVEVVRKREEREKLPSHACLQCNKWFESSSLSEEEKARRLRNCRHKAAFQRPQTPDNYWDLEFPDS